LRMSETTGRPLGSEAWLDALEAQTGRALKPQKRGPKGRDN
jgi:putative transposase